jgi:hypothetical protein
VTTSGTYSFTVALSDVVRHIMLNLGAIGESEVPTSQEFSDVQFKLNMMVKQWLAKKDFAPGLKIWTRQQGNLYLGYSKFQYQMGPGGDNWAAGVTGGTPGQIANATTTTATASAGGAALTVSAITNINNGDFIGVAYTVSSGQFAGATDLFWTTVNGAPSGSTVTLTNTLPGAVASGAYVFNYTIKGQRPEAMVTAVLRDVYGNDTQLNLLNREDYDALPTKQMPTFQSDPTAYLYEPQIGLGPQETAGCGQLFIDCYGAQDVTKHIRATWYRPVQDLNNPGDNPEYPHEWYRALVWGGTLDCAAMFDAVVTEDMQQNYKESLLIAQQSNAEETTFYFQPNAASPYDP